MSINSDTVEFVLQNKHLLTLITIIQHETLLETCKLLEPTPTTPAWNEDCKLIKNTQIFFI